MRRLIVLIASVVVSGFFLWLALRDVPQEEIITNLQQADLGWVLLGIGTIALGLWTRAIRWRGLVGFKVSTLQAFYMFNITMILNQLPLRAGEVARSLLVTRSGVPLMTAATSIIVERLLDTLLVVIWLSLALTQAPSAQPEVVRLAALFGLAAVVAFGVLIFFARKRDVAHNFLGFFERLLPFIKKLNLGRLLDNVLDGIQPLVHWRSAAHAIGWTLISWVISLATFYCLLMAIGVQDNVLLLAVLAITLASFSIAIPVSVASLGPYEGAVRLAGDIVGISQGLSTAGGFLLHGVNILMYAIFGTIGMIAMGVSLGDVLKAAGSKDEPQPETAPSA
ncbi:MAG TPA: lysylphosphatidylglycerol synthase transmembrane domain-containing protein [Phototrophicaceae bacterium]|nr:lysylphosphatidylglycerol synthase transmembrane domain-containing protein [Phototrophicaceae bacterium]